MPSQVWKNVESLNIVIHAPGEFKERKEGKSNEGKEGKQITPSPKVAQGQRSQVPPPVLIRENEKISSESKEQVQRLFSKKR